ncbi:MAG TPA: AI-2E family transporter, partial [Microbacterium sp.]|nr:AI-2E family transporter [Microbacterium sp.]
MSSRRRARTAPPVAADASPSRTGASTAAPIVAETPLPSASSRGTWINLNRPFVVGFFFVFGGLAALALGMAISSLVTIWIYIAFALFIALGLNPLVMRLMRHGAKRAWAITIVYFVFALVIVGVLWLIVPTVVEQIAQFFTDLPSMVTDFQKTDVYLWVRDQFGEEVPKLLAEVQAFLTNPANIAAIGGGVVKIGLSIGTTISGLIIVIVLSLYFLAALPQMKHAFYSLVPARSRSLTAELTEEITDSVGGYLGGMVVLAFFNALMTFILYSLLHLPFPALMAVIAFCITIIPLVGTVLFWGIGSVVALFASPVAALVFA